MGYIPIMTPGERTRWAIVQEVSAIKAGNVHPDAAFAEMSVEHFILAATAIGLAMDATSRASIGTTVSACVNAMLQTVGVNTSLGTILLTVPLAKLESQHGMDHCVRALEQGTLSDALLSLLGTTTSQDCASIYEAIARCKPGGLGTSDQMDIEASPPNSILDAMRLASAWDDVALQYSNGFQQVAGCARRLQELAPTLDELPLAVRRLQGEVLANRMDSLIVRKHGAHVGRAVQAMAHAMLECGAYGSAEYESAWNALDRFLRQPGARKNPGTTADLIAAALYMASPKWI